MGPVAIVQQPEHGIAPGQAAEWTVFKEQRKQGEIFAR
jgi:hypothetical protein